MDVQEQLRDLYKKRAVHAFKIGDKPGSVSAARDMERNCALYSEKIRQLENSIPGNPEQIRLAAQYR